MKCDRCGELLPDRFIQPMFANGTYHNVDPECALKIMTILHEYEFTEFTGTHAQELLDEFRAWKEVNTK